MPTSLHPQAKFDPIPPDLDLAGLVERAPNFKWVQRVSRAQIRNLGQLEFEKLVHIHVIAGGKPLVIDGWDALLPKWLFSAGWLEKTYDKKQENVRDIPAANDIPMTTGHYLRSMKQLTNQWTPHTYRDERRQRLYLKDIDCPPEWREALKRVIYPSLFYLNENVNGVGGAGFRQHDDFRSEVTAAPAGDLMSSLPEEMRAENLMCYIGHEGTYTPAHREMCASLGQNIMVEASVDSDGEKAGSSVWFMTESKDREVVREYFLSMLGHDIEIEKHFAQINAWKKAPFDVYIVDQRAGDFILIPPLAAHQVWNRGTRTMKVAWNRTTVETLDLALHEALPKARLVCRDEQYKNKAIIFFTLQKYFRKLREFEDQAEASRQSLIGIGREIVRTSARMRQLVFDFKHLFSLFAEILVDEVFAFREKDVELLPYDSCITCSYCRSNIFNRFLTCKNCVRTLFNGDEDAYDVCMECYAMGRSCACLSGLQWCEQWTWSELVDRYESWRAMIIAHDNFIDLKSSPQPFEVARLKSAKKSVAQICQEALRRRPWKDISKRDCEKNSSDSEKGHGGDIPKRKPKRKKKKGDIRRCHVCCHKDYSYRVHECTNPGCFEGYCYGVLYRAFDLMPQRVLEDEYWQCPKCLGICSCGSCRRSGNTDAYTPKNTMLGHDTRPIADDRSVEALVDFRIHNLSWLKAVGEESRSKDSRRMQRLREQADSAKAQHFSRQVEVEQAISDDKEAVNSLMTTNDEIRLGNEYEDTIDTVKQPGLIHGEYDAHREFMTVEDDSSMTGNPTSLSYTLEPDVSSYPDPSMFIRQRIGMGYYEQDDTPDKILFDPYQAPTANSVKLLEAGVSEFAKKSMRAAKRKARRENEDPDFVMSKVFSKRPRLAQQVDSFENVDPALFEDKEEQQCVVNKLAEDPQTRFLQPKEKAQDHINEPTLRHAKPMTSYIELEDADLEEYDADDLGLRTTDSYISTPAENANVNLTNTHTVNTGTNLGRPLHQGPMKTQSSAIVTELNKSKRRGRPPKQPLLAKAYEEQIAASTKACSSEFASSVKRGRGRPRKFGILPTQQIENRVVDPECEANAVKRGKGRPRKFPNPALQQIEDRIFDLDREISTAKRGRGRPRKSASLITQQPKGQIDSGREIKNVKRGRGRPRKGTNPIVLHVEDERIDMRRDGCTESLEIRNNERGIASTLEIATPYRNCSPTDLGRRRGERSGLIISSTAAPGTEAGTTINNGSVDRSAGRDPTDMTSRGQSVPSLPPKRQRGLPRLMGLTQHDPSTSREAISRLEFMSMAERMALQGKGFKMGIRKSQSGPDVPDSRISTPKIGGHDPKLTWNVTRTAENEQCDVRRSPAQLSNVKAKLLSPRGELPATAESPEQRTRRGSTMVKLADLDVEDDERWCESARSVIKSSEDRDTKQAESGQSYRPKGRLERRKLPAKATIATVAH